LRVKHVRNMRWVVWIHNDCYQDGCQGCVDSYDFCAFQVAHVRNMRWAVWTDTGSACRHHAGLCGLITIAIKMVASVVWTHTTFVRFE